MSIAEKEKWQARILLILLCVTIFAFVAYVAQGHKPMQLVKYIEPELPNLIQIQRRLNELEPDNPIDEDGVYGKNTREKWERVWMNEQARKSFE
jgi:hypothetical protein